MGAAVVGREDGGPEPVESGQLILEVAGAEVEADRRIGEERRIVLRPAGGVGDLRAGGGHDLHEPHCAYRRDRAGPE